MLGTTLQTLHKAVEDKRSANPDPAIAYHSKVDDPGQSPPGSFSLQRKHHVYACFEGTPLSTSEGAAAEPQARQDSLAASLPLSTWAASKLCKPIWIMRWAAQGLMPVRPQIVLMEQVELPPNSTLKC